MTSLHFLLYFLVLSLPLTTSRLIHARSPPSVVEALSFAPLPAGYKVGLNRRMEYVAITPVGSLTGSLRSHSGSEPPTARANSQGEPIHSFEIDAPHQPVVMGVPLSRATEVMGVPVHPQPAAAAQADQGRIQQQGEAEVMGVPAYPQPGVAPQADQARIQQQREAEAVQRHLRNACKFFGTSAFLTCTAIISGVEGHIHNNDALKAASAVSGSSALGIGIIGASQLLEAKRRPQNRPGGEEPWVPI